MTREEAIEILDRYAHHSHSEVIKYPREVATEAFEMAIASLKAQPCEDAVSRKKVLYHLNLAIKDANDFMEGAKKEGKEDFYMGRKYVATYIRNIVADMESVTPKPRTGHWVEIGDEPYDTWECDNCGFVIDGSGCVDPEEYRDIYKFCPNCGAKMEGESE